MIGLYCNKIYGSTTNHDYVDDDGDNGRNKDGNNDDNAASGLGSDGPIFDPIMTPRSLLGLAVEVKVTTTLRPRSLMYLHVGIYLPYKHPINAILIMCHKLLYAKIGVLDLCC